MPNHGKKTNGYVVKWLSTKAYREGDIGFALFNVQSRFYHSAQLKKTFIYLEAIFQHEIRSMINAKEDLKGKTLKNNILISVSLTEL